jgi:hypothetical protein
MSGPIDDSTQTPPVFVRDWRNQRCASGYGLSDQR